MTLSELEEAVDGAIEHAKDCLGGPANEIIVSVQIDTEDGESIWTSEVELHYDNDTNASGCVLLGYKINEDDPQRADLGLHATGLEAANESLKKTIAGLVKGRDQYKAQFLSACALLDECGTTLFPDEAAELLRLWDDAKQTTTGPTKDKGSINGK